MELLKQPQFKVLPFEEQVAILFAGTGGYLDQIPLERVKEFEAKLLEQLKNQHPEILKNIHESRDLSEETRGELQKAIEAFSEDFKQSHEIETTAQK